MSLFTALLLVVGCTQVPASGQAGGKYSIEGVWQTVVTPRICSNGNPVGPVFPGILMFENGGTMTGTSTAVTSVYGVWKRETGARQYSFASISQRYDAAGVLIGFRRITQNVTLDDTGATFTSSGGFQDSDVNGNTTMTGCSTSTGTRFE
jgi:hypothetical protein